MGTAGSSRAPFPGRSQTKTRSGCSVRFGMRRRSTARWTCPGQGWSGRRATSSKTIVSVASLDEQNEVRVSVDANASAVLSQVFPTIGGFLLSAAVGASLELGLVAGLSTAAIGIGTGFTVGRTIWHQVRKKALDRSRRILAAATSALPVGTSNHDDGDDA